MCIFASEMHWCGRLISSEGIRLDLRRVDGLRIRDPPMNVVELQQCMCALQWVKNAIPSFAVVTEPLHKFMETVLKIDGKGTKRAVASVSLDSLG